MTKWSRGGQGVFWFILLIAVGLGLVMAFALGWTGS